MHARPISHEAVRHTLSGLGDGDLVPPYSHRGTPLSHMNPFMYGTRLAASAMTTLLASSSAVVSQRPSRKDARTPSAISNGTDTVPALTLRLWRSTVTSRFGSASTAAMSFSMSCSVTTGHGTPRAMQLP